MKNKNSLNRASDAVDTMHRTVDGDMRDLIDLVEDQLGDVCAHYGRRSKKYLALRKAIRALVTAHGQLEDQTDGLNEDIEKQLGLVS